ncbi:MAG: hypothetical protein JO199_03520 [Candidatus Eremiobacteraeota bacterium]|nr:hypothetical protein [Candidatus Eremiobacteraeota bacterium]
MHRKTHLLASLAAAALLAACSGGNLNSLPASQSPASPDGLRGPVNSAFIMRDDNGRMYPGTHAMLTRERMHALAAHRRGSSNLNYYGGPVQTTPHIYVVYWGFNASGADPNGEQTRNTNFLSAVGGSQWLSTVTQYYQSGPSYIQNNSGELVSTWVDSTDSVPSSPTDAQVAAEAVKLAQHFGAYSENNSYVVATPHGHNTSGFATQWCAYHSTTSYGGTTIPYTNMPYMSDGGTSCGENSVNSGSAGILDGVTIVGGHELAETQTDPGAGNGWLDSSGNEIGDKCAWVSLRNNSYSNGTYPNQPLWSNSANGCVQ